MYAPRMAFQGTLIHFIKLAYRSKSGDRADFPAVDFFQLINALIIRQVSRQKLN